MVFLQLCILLSVSGSSFTAAAASWGGDHDAFSPFPMIPGSLPYNDENYRSRSKRRKRLSNARIETAFPEEEEEVEDASSRYRPGRAENQETRNGVAVNDPRDVVELSVSFFSDDCDGEAKTHSEVTNNNKRQSHFLSTGTTISGVVGDSFVVLGADTRSTNDRIVADKRASKIHPLARNVYACGAGTAADLDHVTRFARYSFQLQARRRESIGNAAISIPARDISNGAIRLPDFSISVHKACRFLQKHLLSQGGSCQANLIVGGVFDCEPVLRALHPHGSMDVIEDYTALGSGSLAALSVLETRYPELVQSKGTLTEEDAVQLVQDAILAGIDNDLGSGSQVDICIVRVDGSPEYIRASVPEEELGINPSSHDANDDDETISATDAVGVNGFGNVPFAITTQRQLAKATSERKRRTNEEQEWNRLLGLPGV